MALFGRKYATASDEELLIIFKEGKESVVMDQLYRRYAHLIMGTALKYLRQISDAEDIVMLVFEQLPEKLRRHDIQNFKAWLHMVTKNQCLMELRKTKREIPDELNNISEGSDVYDTLIDEQIKLTIETIDTLKEPQQSCIRLFYLDKKSYVEISDLLSLDLKTVKSAIQNGKRNIKLQLIHRDEFK